MHANPTRRDTLARSAPRLLLQLVAWPLLGFLIIAFDDLAPSLLGRTLSPRAGSEWWVFLQWGLFTPLVVQLALRFPVIVRTARNLAIHIAAALLLSVIQLAGEPMRAIVIARVPAPEYLSHAFSRDLLVYASIAVAAHLVVLARRRAAAEHDALAAEADVAEAERALLAQTVAPELIIRSLDEIARRIRDEPARVEPLVERFSDFLRARVAQPGQEPEPNPEADSEAPLVRELGG
jgi:hypothetical protein